VTLLLGSPRRTGEALKLRRAVLCSIGQGPHEELLELARPSFQRYADRFGYDLDLRTELLAPDRPPSWSKVPLIRQGLEDHRVAIWIDADAVVVRPQGRPCCDRVAAETPRNGGTRVRRPTRPELRSDGGPSRPNDRPAPRRDVAKTEYLNHKWWENAALLDLMGFDISTEPIAKVGAKPTGFARQLAVARMERDRGFRQRVADHSALPGPRPLGAGGTYATARAGEPDPAGHLDAATA